MTDQPKNAKDMTKGEYTVARREILGLRNFSNRDRPTPAETPPPENTQPPKRATEMTKEEYAKARRNLPR